jgi:hypothetical protein
MWTRLQEQQQRGAQLPTRSGKARHAGEPPAEATRDRAAQEHDRAALDVGGGAMPPGGYPASPLENSSGDPATGVGTGDTPPAPAAGVAWDSVVQPERRPRPARDDLPLPEGK